MNGNSVEKRSILRDALAPIVMIIGVLAVRSSVAEPYVVPTGSMEPTILPGERILVSKLAYGLKIPFTNQRVGERGKPQRGEVIVFRYPRDPSTHFVKRLIGLPGDVVLVQDGFISINGKPLSIEPTTRHQSEDDSGGITYFSETLDTGAHPVQRLPHLPLHRTQTFVVPQGSYFFMGDNRDISDDSRNWGFVPEAFLLGKVLGVWFSLETTHGIWPMVRWDRLGKGV